MEENKTSKKKYYLILTAMYAGLFFIAWSINFFVNKAHTFSFINIYPWYFQIAAGLAAGLVAGIAGGMVTLKDPYFAAVKEMLMELFFMFRLTIADIILLCVLAGVIEEMLFRGVIQAIAGIWLTSFIFIFIHGYFSLKNKNLTVFGIIMFFISVGIGYMYEYSGMITAMSFHFSFDLSVLILYFIHINKESIIETEHTA